MKHERIYLSPPHLSGNEINSLGETLDSNWIAPAGPDLSKFEDMVAEFTGCGYAAALHSATASIHVALRLLNIGPGDLVFVQTHNHVGSVYPIIYQGATPVFIDSEPESWNMDPQVLEQALEKYQVKSGLKIGRKAVILPVHLYGMPADMQAIMEIANKYGIPVIEDAAESLGSKYFDQHTGTLGRIGVYSFNGNKIITTGGGGVIVSNDKKLINKAINLATQARDPEPFFQHSDIGYNYRLSNVLAGIGIEQVKVLHKRIEQRRANHQRYREYFQKWNDRGFEIRFQEEPHGSFSNRWLTCILVDPATNFSLTSENLRLALEERNIESRPLWKPMHLQPVFNHEAYIGHHVAETLYKQGLCLPSGSNLTENDFQRIFKAMNHVFSSVKP